jgi:hypothetical protein
MKNSNEKERENRKTALAAESRVNCKAILHIIIQQSKANEVCTFNGVKQMENAGKNNKQKNVV